MSITRDASPISWFSLTALFGLSALSGCNSGTTAPAATPALGVGFGNEQFVTIAPGSFLMGSNAGFFTDEQPVHTVTLTQSFQIQRTELTQGQWREIMGSNPSNFVACGDRCPVERLSWDDIQGFLVVLNARFPGRNYRLPTEAQWEYAARAGTTAEYSGTGVLDQMGWYDANGMSTTHVVASKLPNAWGLYDVHGNAWEWVQDWYGPYPPGNVTDPTGPTSGTGRVLRSGSYFIPDTRARSAARGLGDPAISRSVDYGFRLARNP